MDTYLTTRLVASACGMFECILLAGVALQITLHVPDAREGVLLQYMYLSMQENEGQVASKVKCVMCDNVTETDNATSKTAQLS